MTKWLIGIAGSVVASVAAGIILWWLIPSDQTDDSDGPTPNRTISNPSPTPSLSCAFTLLHDSPRTCTIDAQGPGILTINLQPNLRVVWDIGISGVTSITEGCEFIGDLTPRGPTSFAATGNVQLRCQVPGRVGQPGHDIQFSLREPQAANFDLQVDVELRP